LKTKHQVLEFRTSIMWIEKKWYFHIRN